MPEQTARTLNHFSLLAFKDAYWSLDSQARASFHKDWLARLQSMAQNVDVFQFTGSQADLFVWLALPAHNPTAAAVFFDKVARAHVPFRHLIEPVNSLWGFTRPSQYTKTRSAQEIDPFAETRRQYLIMYPFTKTAEWYLMSR